jgi:hypothetical protein
MPKQGQRKHSDVNGLDFVYSGSKWVEAKKKQQLCSDDPYADYPFGDY